MPLAKKKIFVRQQIESLAALLLILTLFDSSILSAQKRLHFECIDIPSYDKKLNKNEKKLFLENEVNRSIKNKITLLNSYGHLLAQVDTLIEVGQENTIKIKAGKKFSFGQIKIDSSSQHIIKESRIKLNQIEKSYFNPEEFGEIQKKTIVWCENNGYPFAETFLDSIKIENEKINAIFKIKKNRFVTIDSIIVKGNANVKKNFLQNYLDIHMGEVYNEKKFTAISKRIRQVPFLKELKPALFYIDETYHKIILTLDKKNNSQFDGILGILPDQNGKTIFTGDVKIKLQNLLLRSGESLELNWRRLQIQTQDLKAKLNYPYLFNTRLGTEYAIKLYKKDTLFIDVQQNFSLQFLFQGLNSIKAIYKTRSSNLISTFGLENLSSLPEYADIKTQSYGTGIFIEALDYKFNPRKGFSFQNQSLIGNRIIKKNSGLNEIVYNNLQLNSTQFQIESELAFYIPFGKKSTWKNGFQFGSVGGNKVFKNELFRIGGFKSFRGFDEESIFASTYMIYSLEYRFLFEENSNLFLFSDLGWYENNSSTLYLNDTPFSFGAGINFETKTGILSLNYALGSQLGNGIDFRSGKIHFGLINIF